jgi:hypothetical protein
VLNGTVIDLVLPAGCVLEGVVQRFSVPVPNVQVVPAHRVDGEWRPVFARTGRTDSKGRFTLTGVPTGSIRLLLYVGLEHPAGSKGAWRAVPRRLSPFRAKPGQDIDLGTIKLAPQDR